MPKIIEMYAFVVEDSGPDDEGLAAMKVGTGWMPMVGADMARVESLRGAAKNLAQALGKPIKVLHFTQREDVEVISPPGWN